MDLRNFAQVIRELAEEKGVAEAKVVETIELAIAAAYKKDYGKKGQIIRAKFNPETGGLNFSQIKIILDENMVKSEEDEEESEKEIDQEVKKPPLAARGGGEEAAEEMVMFEGEEIKKVRFNPERHIMIDEALTIKKDVKAGEELEFALEAKEGFGRIASQTAKQVIIQRIREAEREATYSEYKAREGEIASGIIQRVEGRNVFIDLGRGTGLLPAEEQIPRERFAIGERLKALILAVEKEGRGPGIILSRSHPRFLKKLFELEVPEILSGSVEIKAIAREAGSRSKIAAASNDPAIDPVGSMVGQRGVRVSTVMNEISGEKIDIIEWSDEVARFIANALSPAKTLDVEINEERHDAAVITADEQLSLAIGKGGQNVRLAAKLTGWKIDVRSKTIRGRIESQEESRTEGADEEPAAEEPADAAAGEKPGEENDTGEISPAAEESQTEENQAEESPSESEKLGQKDEK